MCANVCMLFLTYFKQTLVVGDFAQAVKFQNRCLCDNLPSRLVASQLAQLSKRKTLLKNILGIFISVEGIKF